MILEVLVPSRQPTFCTQYVCTVIWKVAILIKKNKNIWKKSCYALMLAVVLYDVTGWIMLESLS